MTKVLDKLRPDVVRVLGFAAVIGPEFDRVLLRHLVHRGEAELGRLLTVAVRSGALAEEAVRRYRFTDADLCRTLYDGLDEPVRRSVHRRVGELTAELPGGTEADRTERVAHHFTAALPYGSVDKALHYTVEAGKNAAENGAHAAAAALFERALRLTELAAADGTARGTLPAAAGSAADAAAVSSESAGPGRTDALRALRCELLGRLGTAYLEGGRPDDARHMSEQAAALARDLGSPRLLSLVTDSSSGAANAAEQETR